jgi:hypothetical protein
MGRVRRVGALAGAIAIGVTGVASADSVIGAGRNGNQNANEFVFAARATSPTAASGLMSFVGTENGRVLAGTPECVKVVGNVANVVWKYDTVQFGQNSTNYVGNLVKIRDNGIVSLAGFADHLNNFTLTEAQYPSVLAGCQSSAAPVPPTSSRLSFGDIRVTDDT